MTAQSFMADTTLATGTALPDVSVIIITKGRHELARQAIASVLACNYSRGKMQLIVVEETESPRQFDGVDVYRAIPVMNLGFGYARNVGLSLAASPIIVFVDDDCEVKSDWLLQLVTPLLADKEIAAVAGAILLPEGSGVLGQCESILGFPGGGIKYVHDAGGSIKACASFSTCSCSVRKSAIDEVGRFREDLRYGGEDEDVSRRIAGKYRILFNPMAIVRHKPRGAFSSIFKWFVRRGRAAGVVLLNNMSWRSLFQACIKSQSFRLLCTVLVVTLLRLPVLPVIALLAITYFVVVLSRVLWSVKYYPSTVTLMLVPLVKLIMDLGMDAGIMVSVVIGKGKN